VTQPPRSIRPLVRADIPAIVTLVDAVGLFPSALLAAMVLPFFEDASCQERWLTVDDSGPVAVAYVAPERMTEGTWNLLLIAVLPQRQGQGVGTALLCQIEQELAALGQRLLLVETSGLSEFEGTRAFYRRRGYDEEARIRDYYCAGEDKLVFRKALAVWPPVHLA
jgi:ribosomal protein S18 acetylase RimI-like enzyme